MLDSTLPGLSPNDGVQHRIVRVSPEMAALWLSRNVLNRTVAQHVIDQYAADMRHDWKFTGQPVVFDSDGRLIDGQHRLMAQIKADVVLDWLVITGVEVGTQDFIDIGRPRTVANQLQIKGVTFSNAIAAVARLELIYSGERNPSKPTIRERAEKDIEAFAKAGHIGRSIAQTLGGSSAAYGVAHYRLSLVDPEAADTFFEAIAVGANLPETNPVLVGRGQIMRLYKGSARGWTEAGRCQFVDYLFKTWNLWRDGKSVKSFSRPADRVEPK